jgi:Uma2 family endonuclease
MGVLSTEWEALGAPPGHRWEILGGELVLSYVASPDHNRAANRLWVLLDDRLPAGPRVGTDLDWALSIPGDLPVIVSAPRLDGVVWPREHPTVLNPVLAVEVLSDGDRPGRIQAKRSAYAAARLPGAGIAGL